MRFSLIFLIVAFAISSWAQEIEYVKEHAAILADPKMKGRGYVDDGLRCAAKHIAKEFKSLGLLSFGKDYYQSFHHTVNSFPSKVEFSIDHQDQKPGEDFLIDPASPLYSAMLKARVFDLSDKSLLPHPEDIKNSCEDCVLVLDVRQVKDKEFLKEARQIKYLYSQYAPVIWLSDAKRTWAVSDKQIAYPIIESSSDKIEYGSIIEIKIDAQLKSDFESKNVIAYVPGSSDPDSIVVFTAHYDHLGMMGKEACFNGANDNASGTAFIMSLAKHYVESPENYTCVFIAFAAEEAGLKGSKFFIDNPLFDLERIRFVINLDLMGSGIDGITVVNAKDNAAEFQMMKSLNEEYDLLPQIKSRGQTANSDHYYFAEAGIPAIFIYALGGSQAYHDVYDVSSNLTFDEYSDIFKLLTLMVDKL